MTKKSDIIFNTLISVNEEKHYDSLIVEQTKLINVLKENNQLLKERNQILSKTIDKKEQYIMLLESKINELKKEKNFSFKNIFTNIWKKIEH